MAHRAQSKDAGLSNNERSSMTIASMDAVAGAVAGGVSRTVTSPLDVIKIRFQVQIEPTTRLVFREPPQRSKYNGIIQAARDIVREEGIVGLWRGNVPALLMVMPYTAIQFVVLHKLKTFITGSTKGEDYIHLNSMLSFLSGALAGCAATVGSYPFDFLRTILASQGEPKVFPNLRAAFFGTLKTRGLPGLYAGLTPTLVEIIPYAGIQFGSYDTFKRWAMGLNRRLSPDDMDTTSLTKLQLFTCGFAAGTTAKIVCHPLDVVKKRFQVNGLKRHPRYGAYVETNRSLLHTTKQILKIEGAAGLYKGLIPSLVKAAPASAITFVTYEFVSEWLQAFVK